MTCMINSVNKIRKMKKIGRFSNIQPVNTFEKVFNICLSARLKNVCICSKNAKKLKFTELVFAL